MQEVALKAYQPSPINLFIILNILGNGHRAKHTGEWAQYKEALTLYNNELRRSKRKSWRALCEDVSSLPQAARLHRVLSRTHSNGISLLQKADGSFTEDARETLDLLMKTHFPDSKSCITEVEMAETEQVVYPLKWARSQSGRIFTPDRVSWAVNSFKPYKAPGGDGIIPAFLQKGLDYLLPILVRLMRKSYEFGYIPKLWREVNVIFIPKIGRGDLQNPRSYRPISLTSFLLKAMEKC